MLNGLSSGAIRGSAYIQTSGSNPVAASATATLATAVADNAIVIGITTLTAKAEPANENQFLVTGSDTVVAAALAAAINVHTVLSLSVSATSAAGVVTITAKQRGTIGNHILISKSGAPITLSGAALAGGTGGAQSATHLISR